MPMYEYKCDDCDEKFEAIARTTDKDIVECPKCGKKVRKLVSAFSLRGGYFGSTGFGGGGGGGCFGGG